jgi:hypothetical protein
MDQGKAATPRSQRSERARGLYRRIIAALADGAAQRL